MVVKSQPGELVEVQVKHMTNVDKSMLVTPYGQASLDAYTILIPNEATNRVIGKNGENIRALQFYA